MNYGRRILIFLVSVLVLFAGAYLVSKTGGNTQEALEKAVQTMWDARAARDWPAVYNMTSNEFRQKISLEIFVMKSNIHVTEYDIKEVTLLESKKEGKAVVDYTMNQMGFEFKTTAREKWVWEEGAWHLNIPYGSPFKSRETPQ